MAHIKYIATRNIEKTTFVISAVTDVSASSVDNSFNAPTTDLSGLLSGQWVYVTGFTDAANNGWHQLTADATANKITTSSTLVTEAAGDSIDMQGYVRGEGQEYDLDFGITQLGYPDKVNAKTNESLSGVTETVLNHIKSLLSMTTDNIDELTEAAQWFEFLHSVSAGELFTFDAFGTSSTPDNPQTVKRLGGWTRARRQNMRRFRLSFTMEVQA